jgi:hypothetical protein
MCPINEGVFSEKEVEKAGSQKTGERRTEKEVRSLIGQTIRFDNQMCFAGKNKIQGKKVPNFK